MSPATLATYAASVRQLDAFLAERSVPVEVADVRREHGKGVPGRLELCVDGVLVASADAPHTTPRMFNPGGVSCGPNPGSPVAPVYTSPLWFTGRLEKAVVDVSGDLIGDSGSEPRKHMARQQPGRRQFRPLFDPGGRPPADLRDRR